MTKRSAPPRPNSHPQGNKAKGQKHSVYGKYDDDLADTDGYTSSKPVTKASKPRPQREEAPTRTYNPDDRVQNQLRQALDLWREWLDEPNWYQLDRWLKQTLAKNKKYGKRDRLIYGDILFNAARFSYFAATLVRFASASGEASHAVAAIADVTTNAVQLNTLLSQIAHSPQSNDFLALCQWRASGEERLPNSLNNYQTAINKLRELSVTDAAARLTWHGIPLVYLTQLQNLNTLLKDNTAMDRFLVAQDTRPPLWLRLNHADKKHAAIAELAEHYLISEDKNALSVTGERGIFGLECYQNGIVEIQDWASQQLAAKVAATPGQKVWDACAGGGGKTLAIAAPLNNKGAVWATDIREHKLAEVKRRAKLANFYNVRTAPWQGDEPFRLPKEIANHGGFDWVLVDGPCSSSGTWRRNPDAKLRNLGEDLTSLTQLQLQLLTNASKSVNPTGKLVYGTCSFYEIENNTVIQNFVTHNPEWQVLEAELIGCPNNNSDTLFAAVLQRKLNT